ncbi:hypothetical protein EDC01DRAFT_404740 [Geopyxis carbonaria]|nr:hypothetical protein EDC01DRAFT_404740 [Geopyxis carbonaria]
MAIPEGPKTETTRQDLALASIFWGFTLGFGFLTTWTAIQQTMAMSRPWRSMYLFLVWGELIANFCFGILAYLFMADVLSATLPVMFSIVFFWCFQVQFLLQIIVNRICVILGDRRKRRWLKLSTIILWVLINISGFCIWVPARLGVSNTFTDINYVWDRSEKAVYMLVDCGLNWYFIRLVNRRLVEQGSTKYARLVRFNTRIIMASISMDVLLIGLMNLKNDLIYLQVHPLTFIVKLNIEMSMASLIRRIASEKLDTNSHPSEVHHGGVGGAAYGISLSITGGKGAAPNRASEGGTREANLKPDNGVMVHKSVVVESHSASGCSVASIGSCTETEEESPLRK